MLSKIKHILILVLTTGLIGINIFYFYVYRQNKKVEEARSIEPGYQFLEFRPYLENIKTIGYITQKSLERESNDGIYLQAQYFLAPTIIKQGEWPGTYNIIDSEDINFLIEQFRATNSRRIANNLYGQALIKRKE